MPRSVQTELRQWLGRIDWGAARTLVCARCGSVVRYRSHDAWWSRLSLGKVTSLPLIGHTRRRPCAEGLICVCGSRTSGPHQSLSVAYAIVLRLRVPSILCFYLRLAERAVPV